MKLLSLFLFSFVLAGGLAGSPCFAAVALVEEGMPAAEVILAADATPDEMSAANELARFVEKSTGATLPIRREHNFVWEDRQPVVVVGLTPAPEHRINQR